MTFIFTYIFICTLITFILTRFNVFAYGLIISIEYKRTWINVIQRLMFSILCGWFFVPAAIILTPIIFVVMGIVESVKFVGKKFNLKEPPKWI